MIFLDETQRPSNSGYLTERLAYNQTSQNKNPTRPDFVNNSRTLKLSNLSRNLSDQELPETIKRQKLGSQNGELDRINVYKNFQPGFSPLRSSSKIVELKKGRDPEILALEDILKNLKKLRITGGSLDPKTLEEIRDKINDPDVQSGVNYDIERRKGSAPDYIIQSPNSFSGVKNGLKLEF